MYNIPNKNIAGVGDEDILYHRVGKPCVNVFTNGCFDLLHAGHIYLLKKARELGEFLLVGINSDKSIRKIKGGNRPIIPQEQREEMLMALECVNSVFIFDEQTPYDLIRWVQPTIIVKGGDWAGKEIVGSDLVERVEIIPFVHNVSTTSIINKIKGE